MRTDKREIDLITEDIDSKCPECGVVMERTSNCDARVDRMGPWTRTYVCRPCDEHFEVDVAIPAGGRDWMDGVAVAVRRVK